MRPDRTWTISEGLEELRKLEALVHPLGCGTAIGGSVAYRGHSAKDLDLFVFPLNASVPFPHNEVANAIRVGMGYTLAMSFANIKEIRSKKPIAYPPDNKYVDAWYSKDKRRVSIFILEAR